MVSEGERGREREKEREEENERDVKLEGSSPQKRKRAVQGILQFSHAVPKQDPGKVHFRQNYRSVLLIQRQQVFLRKTNPPFSKVRAPNKHTNHLILFQQIIPDACKTLIYCDNDKQCVRDIENQESRRQGDYNNKCWARYLCIKEQFQMAAI